jgi:tRNA-splicing ligase RtcB
VIVHRVREVFSEVFNKSPEELDMRMVFDIAHNRGTFEKHEVDGKVKELIVHRKGATGSYYPGREEIPEFYRKDGSPVIIGGSMETGSYLLVGGPNAKETFCSIAHGSGRTMSRAKAKRMVRERNSCASLRERNFHQDRELLPAWPKKRLCLKNIDDVVEATALAGFQW